MYDGSIRQIVGRRYRCPAPVG